MERAVLSRGVLAAASLFVALSLGEIGLRWMLPEPPVVRVEPAPAPAAALPARRFSVAQYPERGGLYLETASGRRLRANTHVTVTDQRLSRRTIEIQTNSLGYRGDEIGAKRGTRILFLGDSITFGDYLHEDETFVRRVERAARAEGNDWETINAGVGGIGLANELAILVETGLSIDPDVVVLDFYLNDFEHSPGVYPPTHPAWLRWSRLAQLVGSYFALERSDANSSLTREELGLWREELERRWPAGGGDFTRDAAAFNALLQTHVRDWGGAWTDAAWQRIEPLLAELRRLSREYSFRLLIVAFPVRHQVVAEALRDEPQARLREIANRLEIPLLDLLPILRAEFRRTGVEFFYDQCHHTPRANRVLARSIGSFLRTELESPGPE